MRDVIEMAREAGFTEGELAFMGDNFRRFAELVRADERKNLSAVLRQMHDAYSLASDPAGLKVRGNT
jgi:hypothetical protein